MCRSSSFWPISTQWWKSGYRGRAGELAQQVHRVFVAVGRVVEHGVGVGENLLGGDSILSGQHLEVVAPLLPVVPVDAVDAPPRDVAHPLPVLRVSVEGEALGFFQRVVPEHFISRQNRKWFVGRKAGEAIALFWPGFLPGK